MIVSGDLLKKYQDDIPVWIIPELFLKDDRNKYQDDIRLRIVPKLLLEDSLE